jgi:uncharacterized protein YjbI with pentapeptide repeats
LETTRSAILQVGVVHYDDFAVGVKSFLSDINLGFAILLGISFRGANLSGANLKNISWNEETNWEQEHIGGLDRAKEIPEALKRELGLG